MDNKQNHVEKHFHPMDWLVSRLDKKHRLARARDWCAAQANKKPRLKKALTIAMFVFAAGNVITQIISFPLFGAALGRKNSSLKDDYAAAAACEKKMENDEPCTLDEVKSLKRAWDNDIMMCYAYGAGCVAAHYLNKPEGKPLPYLPPKMNFNKKDFCAAEAGHKLITTEIKKPESL